MQYRRLYLTILASRLLRVPIHDASFWSGMKLLWNVAVGTCDSQSQSIDVVAYYGIHVFLRIVYGLSGIYLLIYMAKWIRRTVSSVRSQ